MKKLLLAGVAALFLATGLASSPATAQSINIKKYYLNMLPPAQYDKPYTGKLTIRRVETEKAIVVICPDSKWGCAVPPGRTCMGCAVPPDRRCDIYIANDEILKTHHLTYAFALRHELGHCNGWADHKDGQWVRIDSVKTFPTLPESTQVLPIYPPVVCVTPEWKAEPCKNRLERQALSHGHR